MSEYPSQKYKYRVYGPKGAVYETTTLEEARRLTRNGGSYERIGGRLRAIRGGQTANPLKLTQEASPTDLKEMRPTLIMGADFRTHYSASGEPYTSSGESVAKLSDDVMAGGPDGVKALADLTWSSFMDATMRADSDADKLEEDAAAMLKPFANMAHKDKPRDILKEADILIRKAKVLRADPSYQGVRKTARYLLKQMLQLENDKPRFSFDKSVTIWSCAVLDTLRNIALGKDITDFGSIYSPEEINKAAGLTADKFYAAMASGDLKPIDFNIFGDVSIWKDDNGDWQFSARRESLGAPTTGAAVANPVRASEAPWLPSAAADKRRQVFANPASTYRSHLVRNPTDEEMAIVEAQLEFLEQVLETAGLRENLGDAFVDLVLTEQRTKLIAELETEPEAPEEVEVEEEFEEEVPVSKLPTTLAEAKALSFEEIANLIFNDPTCWETFGFGRGDLGDITYIAESEERIKDLLSDPRSKSLLIGMLQSIPGFSVRATSSPREVQLLLLGLMPEYERFYKESDDGAVRVQWSIPISAYSLDRGTFRKFVSDMKKAEALKEGLPVHVYPLKDDEGKAILGQAKLFVPAIEGLEVYDAKNMVLESLKATLNDAHYKLDKYTTLTSDDGENLYGKQGYILLKLTPEKIEALTADLKERSNFHLKPSEDIAYLDIPAGYDDVAVLEFVDVHDVNRWGYAAERAIKERPSESFAALSEVDYTKGGEILRKIIPAASQMVWVQEGGYVPGDVPWYKRKSYNLTNMTEKQAEELREALEAEKIYLNVVGTPKYGVDITLPENNVPLKIQKVGSNVTVVIPEEYGKMPIMFDGVRTNVYDAAARAMLEAGAYDKRADPDAGTPRTFVFKFSEFPSKGAPALMRVPGVKKDNIEKLKEDLKAEVFERARLLKWAETAPLRMGAFKGKWQGPKWFQEEGIRFLMGRKAAILADDRGLGKTIQSIVAADTVVPEGLPILVVTPAKLTSNYYKEIQTFAANKKAYILDSQGLSDPAAVRKRELRIIGIWLRNDLLIGDEDEYLGSRVYREADKRYEVNGTSMSYVKAQEEILRIAKGKKLSVVPPTVKYIPDGARWIIVSISTASVDNTLYGRITKYKNRDLTTELGMEQYSLQYATVAALPENGKLVKPSEWADALIERLDAMIKDYNAMGKPVPTSWYTWANEKKSKIQKALEKDFGTLASRGLARMVDEKGTIGTVIEEYAKKLPDGKWPLVIFDEAHYYKNASPPNGPSGRVRYARELIAMAEKVWFLTGTPIANLVVDLWSLLNLSGHKEGFGVNVIPFGKEYAGGVQVPPKNQWSFRGATNMDKLKRETSDVLLWRYKDDVTDIPVQQTYPKYLDMGYDNRDLRDWHLSDASPKDKLGQMSTKLKEIAEWKAPYSAQEALFAVDQGKKVIVFSQYTEPLDILARELDKYIEENPGMRYVRVDGKTDAKKVREAVRSFSEDDDVAVFLGNLKSAGTGLNLQAASYTVFNDFSWDPATVEQAEDRTRRIGQDLCTTVVFMVSDAYLDLRVWGELSRKRAVIEKLQEGRDDPNAFADEFIDDVGREMGVDPKEIDRYRKEQEKERKRLEKLQEELAGDDED